MVTKPRRGSLIRRSRVSATTTLIRSASLRARAVSVTCPSSYGAVGPRPAPPRPRYPSPPGARALRLSLVLVVVQPPAGGQELHLRAGGHQALAAVQHLGAVGRGAGDDRQADLGAAVQILVPGLGGRDTVLPLQLGHDRPDDRP